jgi:fucose permease
MFGLQAVTVVTASAALVFGMVLALLGSLKLALAKRLSLGEGRISFLLSALNFALMPMMIVSGLLTDSVVGPRWVIIAGSLLTGAAIAVLGFKPNYPVAITAVLLAGLGGAGLSTGSIVLMRAAFFPASQTASLNLGCVFFALGALITPVLVDLLSNVSNFRWLALVLGALALVPAVCAALAGGQQFQFAPPNADTSWLGSSQAMWLAALVFFFYAPLEAAVSIWATTFLTELGHGERGATWALSGFWCALLGSRLLTALAVHSPYLTGWEPYLLVIPVALVAVVLGNLAGTASRTAARRGLYLVGFLLGPIFPTLIGILFERLAADNEAANGTAYGLVFATGSLGSLLLAPLIGSLARRRTAQFALRLPMSLAILATLAALVFCLVA